jgi:hypothetical protein
MFDFSSRQGYNRKLFLNPATGEPISQGYWSSHFKKA